MGTHVVTFSVVVTGSAAVRNQINREPLQINNRILVFNLFFLDNLVISASSTLQFGQTIAKVCIVSIQPARAMIPFSRKCRTTMFRKYVVEGVNKVKSVKKMQVNIFYY